MIGHLLVHVLGADSANSPWYLFWSGIGLSLVIGGLSWLRARLARSHLARQLAQAAEHHRERQQQAADHHSTLKNQLERHHQQMFDQAVAHHQALKDHISAQTPTPAAVPIQQKTRKTSPSTEGTANNG